MAFKVVNIGSLLSSGSIGSTPYQEVILPVLFNADGVSQYTLPARANINKMFLVASADTDFSMGVEGIDDLLISPQSFTADQTESFVTFPFLPASITIKVLGVPGGGTVTGVIYYQIIP